MLFDDGFNRLAAGRCPATEQRLHSILGDEFFRLLRAIGCIRTAVRNNHFNQPAIHPARLVRLLHRQPHRIHQRHLARRHRAGQRVQHTDFYARISTPGLDVQQRPSQ